MINMDSNSLLTRWFVWSCDHLPLTTAEYVEKDGEEERARWRTGAYYVSNGTTLCHIFWAVLWAPLLTVALAAFILSVLALMHVAAGVQFATYHPYANPALKVAAYFVPEMAILAVVAVVSIFVLAIIGGSKSGFFRLLWQYLKGIKQHICPIVRFDGGTTLQPAE